MDQLYSDATASTPIYQNDSPENVASDDSLLIDSKWTTASDSEDAVVRANTHSKTQQQEPINHHGRRATVQQNLWEGGCFAENCSTVDSTYPAGGHLQQPSTLDEADVPLLSNVHIPGFQNDCLLSLCSEGRQGESISTDAGTLHCHALRFQSSNKNAWQNLLAVSVLCLLFMIIEIVGGYFAGAVAVMTDAAHLLSDLIGFIVSLSAVGFSNRPATRSFSFGFFRFEVLGALVSTWIIWVLSFVFLYVAIHRLVVADFNIDADTMLIVASLGVVINIVMGVILHGVYALPHSHGHSHTNHQWLEEAVDTFDKVPEVIAPSQPTNINIRAAFIHILGDLLQSIGVVVAAIIIKCLGPKANIADPICTILSSFLVLMTTIPVLKDTGFVLLEGFPTNLDYQFVLSAFQRLPHVRHAHSLHVWSLTLDKLALSIHLAVDSNTDRDQVLQSALLCARDRFGIMYSTIQIELFDSDSFSSCASCQPPE